MNSKRKPGYWTVKRIVNRASKCKNRNEFKHRFQPAYNRARALDMMDELFGPKQSTHGRGGGKRYWTQERLQKTALKCKTRTEFRMKYSSAYMSAYGYNCLDQICSHMPKRIPWVKKRPNTALILKAGAEFDNLKEFKHGYNGGYWNAMRFGLLPEVLENMKVKQAEKEAALEALKLEDKLERE